MEAKKRVNGLAGFLLLVILLYSCNFSGKLTRRYKTYEAVSKGCDINNFVAIAASVIDKDPNPPASIKALHDLSPQGQKALIQELGSMETTSDGLIGKLRADLAVPPDKTIPAVIDFTRMSKRILTSIRKLPNSPGDRIEKLYIKITVNDPNFQLRSCNRVISQYMNVDFGKLSYSNTNQAELTGSLGAGLESTDSYTEADKNSASEKLGDQTLGSERSTNNGLTRKGTSSRGINGKISASRSMSEEVQLRQRLVALSAFIKNNELFLYQEGISGIDLSGNILSDIVCEYVNDVKVEKVYIFDKMFAADGTANPQAGLEIKEHYIQSFNVVNDITATIRFEAVYRRIDKKAKTISESDDEISLVSGTTFGAACTANTFTLIPKTSLRPNTWRLTYQQGAGRLPLHLANAAGAGGEILFYNHSNAVNFLRWLTAGVNNGSINLNNPVGSTGLLLRRGDNVTVPTTVDINSLQLQLNP